MQQIVLKNSSKNSNIIKFVLLIFIVQFFSCSIKDKEDMRMFVNNNLEKEHIEYYKLDEFIKSFDATEIPYKIVTIRSKKIVKIDYLKHQMFKNINDTNYSKELYNFMNKNNIRIVYVDKNYYYIVFNIRNNNFRDYILLIGDIKSSHFTSYDKYYRDINEKNGFYQIIDSNKYLISPRYRTSNVIKLRKYHIASL